MTPLQALQLLHSLVEAMKGLDGPERDAARAATMTLASSLGLPLEQLNLMKVDRSTQQPSNKAAGPQHIPTRRVKKRR